MKSATLICIAALLGITAGCAGKVNELRNTESAPKITDSTKLQPDSQSESKPRLEIAQSIDHNGVTIQNKIPVASGIEAVYKSAHYLEQESDKPDSVVPTYLSLKFRGDYAEEHRQSFYQPEVNIYPIKEFREALGKSKHLVDYLDRNIKELSSIISSKERRLIDLPRIPFHDGEPTMITHLRYPTFGNGKAVEYLTHFDIEPAIIGNDRLTYVFQGLTSDRQYYIFATFPVTLDILPPSDSESFRGYEMPRFFYEPKTRNTNETNFSRYLTSMTKLLEETSDDQFKPSLTSIRNTLATLTADWKR